MIRITTIDGAVTEFESGKVDVIDGALFVFREVDPLIPDYDSGSCLAAFAAGWWAQYQEVADET